MNPNLLKLFVKSFVFLNKPASAYIKFTYNTTINIPSSSLPIQYSWSSFCGGTLISENDILSAAHCFVNRVTFTFENIQYNVTVTPNELFPTYESMYTIYVGMHNKNNVDLAQELIVEKIILVGIINFIHYIIFYIL